MVEYASIRFKSVSITARYDPPIIVSAPATVSAYVQSAVPPTSGVIRAIRYTPALTIVAECRYALTGVGACIAFGSQKWNGNCADLVKAASRIRAVIPT